MGTCDVITNRKHPWLDFFPSANRADLTGGEVQAGKLACMDEHHYLAARA